MTEAEIASPRRRDAEIASTALLEFLPRPRLALAIGACAAMAATAALQPALFPAALAALAVVGVLAVADARLCGRPAALRISRVVSPVLSHGAPNQVVLTVENQGARAVDVELEDVWPVTVEPGRHRLRARVAGGGVVSLRFGVTPMRRGALVVPESPARVHGPLGLVARQARAVVPPAAVRVYPNIAGVGRYELAARRGQLKELGVRSVRALGPGTEIEGLRDYTPDDEYRRIDWKATARRGAPVTRELRDERSQHVVILIDAGRLGAAPLAAGLRIDHAVNAALVLAHVAAIRGDRVGLLVFDREIRRYLPPGRASRAVVPRLARALYDVQARPVEPDYDRAFRYLAARDRRRSLLVLFSDVLSLEASEAIVSHLAHSAGRHLPVCVAIGDPGLAAAARAPLGDAASVYHRAAAAELHAERQDALRAMRERGVVVVDVTPATATPDVVSRYLELKARRVL